MQSQISKDIIKDLRRIHNLTEQQAVEIIKSEFSKLLEEMAKYDLETETYPTIRLPKWGVFFIKPSKKKNYGKTIENTKD